MLPSGDNLWISADFRKIFQHKNLLDIIDIFSVTI